MPLSRPQDYPLPAHCFVADRTIAATVAFVKTLEPLVESAAVQ
jgi:hypothetical protein